MARIDSPRSGTTTILSALRDSKNPLMNRLRVVTALGILGCVGGASQEYGPTPPPDGIVHADGGGTPEPEDAGADNGEGGDGGDGGEPPKPDGASAPDAAGTAPDATQPACVNSDGDPFCDDEEVCDNADDLINPATGEPLNSDSDPLPNACDPCDTNPTDNGEDRDGDGRGDVCDGAPDNADTGADGDNDDVPTIIDNCERSNPPPVTPEPGQNPIQVDADQDGSGPPCDCNDGNDDIHPGATDVPCDGQDRNCDGEGEVAVTYSNSTVTIVGEPTCECIPGTERTTGPSAGPCVPLQEECQLDYDADGNPFSHFVPLNADSAVEPTDELCNNEDDDCDGTTDESLEDCECQNEDTRPCGTDEGPCSIGEQPCVNNQWSDDCEGDVPPAANDPCNNVDDDCDGTIDNAYGTDPDVAACVGLRSGLPGTMRCLDSTHAVCDADSVNATEEICDGIDNNYNGNVDDANFTIVGSTTGATGRPGQACSAGVGKCHVNTTLRCVGNFAVECPTPAPVPEVCGNEEDDDCDGSTDEPSDCACDPFGADADAPLPCGINTGECNEGVRECLSSGQRSVTCGGLGPNGLPYSAGSPEDCNDGEDNDCDGRTDEPVGDDCITMTGEDGEFVCDPTTGAALCLD